MMVYCVHCAVTCRNLSRVMAAKLFAWRVLALLPVITRKQCKVLSEESKSDFRFRMLQLAMNKLMDQLGQLCAKIMYVLCADGRYRKCRFFLQYCIMDGMEVMSQTGCGAVGCLQCHVKRENLANPHRYSDLTWSW